LISTIAEGYRLLRSCACEDALSIFQSLPLSHQNSGWVVCQIARCYFEMNNYGEADVYYSQVRKVEPYRLEGMEYYSTVLWHLRKNVELAALAKELVGIDKTTSEAWVAVGNCFSLQKENDLAIKFFQRAAQVSPWCAYAYTLCGHEYVTKDELEKAAGCYRHAIVLDPRHYNAWFGLGMVYFRQDQWGLSLYHFDKACKINPMSSVLRCQVGKCFRESGQHETALAHCLAAVKLDEQNGRAKFEVAKVLVELERYDEALALLERLRDSTFADAPVYFLLSKIYKHTNKPGEALLNLMTAVDLDTSQIGSTGHMFAMGDESGANMMVAEDSTLFENSESNLDESESDSLCS